jgi:hypothetical protein
VGGGSGKIDAGPQPRRDLAGRLALAGTAAAYLSSTLHANYVNPNIFVQKIDPGVAIEHHGRR